MKQILLVITFIVATIYCRAQEIMHSFGATISVMYGNIETPYSKSSFALSQTNFTYFPRLNFVENENATISIGAPVGIGFGIARNTYGDDAGLSFAYDLPVVLDYNFGAKSSSYNEANLGGYVGAGFGYYKVNVSKSQYSNFNGSSYGPLFRAGMRFASAAESWAGRGMTIGLYYKIGLEKSKFKTAGVNVLLDL